jgi:HK97 family phage major capsid protein
MENTLKLFLETKGIKDISSDFEGATTEEMHSYYTAKLSFEQSELKLRLEVIENGNTEEVEKSKDEIATLKEAIKLQGTTLKAIQTGQLSGATVNGLENSIEKALRDNKDNFAMSKSKKHEFSFEIKAAGDMTNANITGGVVPQAQRLEGINDVAERMTITYPLIPKLNTAANTIEWVYETGQDGTIDGTGEGLAKDQIDNDFVVTSVALVKRAAYFKVSTEMLDDATFMSGWLRNKLIVRLLLDVDSQCLNGNGTAPNLKGIVSYATAFAPGTFATGGANAVDSANNADVLVVAMNQIKLANQGTQALTIQMNPTDAAALKTIKLTATDKRYVDRLLQVGSTLMLDGTPILENNDITVGSYLIGDFSKATIVQKSGITVEVGLDGSDFTKNMRTILAEWRGQLFVQNNDTTAFVKGVFATDAAAIETA